MALNDVPYEYVQAGGYFGPDFTSIYFFENIFWRVVIPLVYGTPKVNTLNALQAMPAEVMQRLVRNERVRESYKLHWADCLDYSQGRHHVRVAPLSGEVAALTAALDRDLCSAIADLSQQQPNSNAMHHSRLAVEKAVKAFLCARHGHTAATVKEFRHNLGKLMNEVISKDPHSEFASIRNSIDRFAGYEERYGDNCYTREDLWEAYLCSQFAASALMRILTPYNQRTAMIASGKN